MNPPNLVKRLGVFGVVLALVAGCSTSPSLSPQPTGTTTPTAAPPATAASTPAPSAAPALPDSLLLAVAGDGEDGVVLTVQPDGDNHEALASGDWADWSPDGRSIVYSCRSGSESAYDNICVMNADGSGQRRVIVGGFHPSWSPDGTQLMFSRSTIDAGDTWVADADGSNPRKIGDGAGSWSPNGSWILLLGASGALPDATVVRPDGSDNRELGDCWGAAWSPDSRRLACTRWEEPQGTLSTIDIATGATSTILEADVAIGDPAWITDDRLAIAMTRAGASASAVPPQNDLYLLDVGSGEPRQLTRDLSITGPIDVSPDGAWLAFVVIDGDTRNVHIVSTAGEALQVTGNGATGAPRWQPGSATGPTSSPAPSVQPPAAWASAPGSLAVASGSSEVAAGPDGGAYVLVSAGGDAMAGRASRIRGLRPRGDGRRPAVTCRLALSPGLRVPARAGP